MQAARTRPTAAPSKSTFVKTELLNCPNCGAPTAPDLTECAHCQTRLTTLSCGNCFGMLFQGSLFCPHCGSGAERSILESDLGKECPKCQGALSMIQVGVHQMVECEKCQGLWVDARFLEQLSRDETHRAAVKGSPRFLMTSKSLEFQIEPVRYYRCPECHAFMNRINYAGYSGVVVDVCKGHGTWFDKDELHRVIQFIERGGLHMARQRQGEELEAKRRQIAATTRPAVDYSDNSVHSWSILEGLAEISSIFW